MAETERLLLTRVADLHHVADTAHHLGQFWLALVLQEANEGGRIVEVILDGCLALAGDDDQVLDT